MLNLPLRFFFFPLPFLIKKNTPYYTDTSVVIPNYRTTTRHSLLTIVNANHQDQIEKANKYQHLRLSAKQMRKIIESRNYK
uniref:Putative ovule protein n=1 Tax=Solanum chacoense TaxID=4108 RepID=A0A0V0GKP9_SOLCH